MRASGRRDLALLPVAFGGGLAWGQIAILLAADILGGGAPPGPLPGLTIGILLAGLLVGAGMAVTAAIPGRDDAPPPPPDGGDARRVAQSVRDAVATIDLPGPGPATA
ncbi:hypothetical protein [Stella sp.]|uniref:hypothetical protein n=1 Tax=Stella sp. TaxID=2912054 RepID=UPI0035AF89C7